MKRLPWLAILALVFSSQAWGVARPDHQHEDIFGESDILLGVKLGPQITGYTTINTGTAKVDVQSTMRAVWGLSAQFIYDVPRFEVDVLWNSRAHLNTSDMYHSVAFPIIAKLPWEIDPGVDLEFGAGYELDFALYGARPHRNVKTGVLGAVGLAVDLKEFVFSFETRYVLGLETIADEVDGAKPRDFQMIAGVAWHF